MSDMIDHLRAISNAAGRDVASQLSDVASIATMASQVRVGVRRRRIRAGIAAASVATAGVALAIALPALLRDLPSDTLYPGRSPVHSTGPLAVYDDGSMQVVLSNGDFLDVAPDPTGGDARLPWDKTEACVLDTNALPPSGWRLDDPSYGRLVSQVLPLVVEGDRMTALFEGASYEADYSPLMVSGTSIKVRIEADPAVASYLSVQTRWAEGRDGRIERFGTKNDGNPWFELEGDADLGTERAVLEAVGPDLGTWSDVCTEQVPTRAGATFDEYVFVDVWLVDRVGTATHIGAYTGSFEMTWKDAS